MARTEVIARWLRTAISVFSSADEREELQTAIDNFNPANQRQALRDHPNNLDGAPFRDLRNQNSQLKKFHAPHPLQQSEKRGLDKVIIPVFDLGNVNTFLGFLVSLPLENTELKVMFILRWGGWIVGFVSEFIAWLES
jgi:hypothetical protein